MEVLGLDHIDLSVTEMQRSIKFYQTVLGALGFSRVSHESYTAWSNGKMNVGLRQVDYDQMALGYNRYRAGLHHIALKMKSREEVDQFYQFLIDHQIPILDPPNEYPQYGSHYYAVFFSDPDGFKWELLHFPWGYWRQVQAEGIDLRPRYEKK